MPRSVAWTAFSLPLVLLSLAPASCSHGGAQGAGSTGTSSSAGAGGAASSSVTSSSSTSTTTGSVTAVSMGAGGSICDEYDGKCDVKNETCMCQDCAATAMCAPDLCTTDGVCDPLFD